MLATVASALPTVLAARAARRSQRPAHAAAVGASRSGLLGARVAPASLRRAARIVDAPASPCGAARASAAPRVDREAREAAARAIEETRRLLEQLRMAMEQLDWRGLLAAAAKPALLAALVLAIAAQTPADALAASGGRMGGSSFSSSRSYSGGGGRSYGGGGSSSYSSGGLSSFRSAPSVGLNAYSSSFFYPAPVIVAGAPGYYGGGGGGGLVTLIFVGFLAYVVFQMVQGVASGERGADGGLALGGDTVAVGKLQVGLLGSARSLQADLEAIADKADTSTPAGLHYVLQETVLALLRNPQYCVYGMAEAENARGLDRAERRFNELSLEERGKFSEETLVNVGGKKRAGAGKAAPGGERNEFIVVTVLVAVDGGLKLPPVTDGDSLRTALKRLGGMGAEQVQACEVLWTPQEVGDVLSREDVTRDYPNLNLL